VSEQLTCYYCDEAAGYSDVADENLGPMTFYKNGQDGAWLHPACYRDMMSNEGCGGDE
jgi:hypothetical protein